MFSDYVFELMQVKSLLFVHKLARVIAIALILGFILLSIQKIDWHGDGGIAIGAVQRTWGGEVLYRDFYQFWMPINYHLLDLWLSLIGNTTESYRILIGIIFVATTILVTTLAIKTLKSWWLMVASVALFLSVTITPSYNHNWLGLFGTLAVVNYVVYANPTNREPKRWFMAGLLSGMVVSSILWQGASVYLASLLLMYSYSGFRKEFWRNLSVFTLGTAIIPGLWLGLYVYKGQLLDLVQSVVLFPFQHYLPGNGLELLSALWITTALLLIWYWWGWFKGRRDNFTLSIVALYGTVYFLVTLGSPTPGHVGLSYAMNAIVFLSVLKSVNIRSLQQSRVIVNRRLSFAVLGRFAIFILFFLNITFFMLYVGLNLYARTTYMLLFQRQFVETPRGYVWLDERWKTILNTISEIEKDQSASAYIGPWASEVYYWYNLKNPTQFVSMGPEFKHPKFEQELIEDLTKSQPTYILYLPTYKPLPESQLIHLDGYIRHSYERVAPIDPSVSSVLVTQDMDGLWHRK